MNSNNNNTVDFSELRNFIKNNYEANRLKKKRRKKIIIILINVLSIGCLIGGGIGIKSIYDYNKDLEKEKLVSKELNSYAPAVTSIETTVKEVVKEEPIDPEITKLFETLTSKNSDTVAWLKVNNTKVDTAIVQADDNKFYLNHDFDKDWNSLGWAFADYRNNFPDLSLNTILYGHTYKRTLVFSSLINVLSKDWLNNEENYYIEFTTSKAKSIFKIFSIYTIKKTNDYLDTDFTEEEYNEFINLVKGRSIRDFNTDVVYGDKILTLSTCYNTSKYRLVIHAKLIDQNEE